MPGLPPPNQQLVDLAALLGADNARVLVRTFLRECPDLLRKLESGDRKTRQRMAHSLKSNARVVGALSLSERMAQLELRLTSDAGPDLTLEEVASLVAEYERAAEPLRAFAADVSSA